MHLFGPSLIFVSPTSLDPKASGGWSLSDFTSAEPTNASALPTTMGSFPLPLPLTKLSIEDCASFSRSCLRIISLWHLEHMFMVAAVPKKPQLLMQRIGHSGAWHPVSSWSISNSPASQQHELELGPTILNKTRSYLTHLETWNPRVIRYKTSRTCKCTDNLLFSNFFRYRFN